MQSMLLPMSFDSDSSFLALHLSSATISAQMPNCHDHCGEYSVSGRCWVQNSVCEDFDQSSHLHYHGKAPFATSSHDATDVIRRTATWNTSKLHHSSNCRTNFVIAYTRWSSSMLASSTLSHLSGIRTGTSTVKPCSQRCPERVN